MAFEKPRPDLASFTCPHCGIHAKQNWSTLMTQFDGSGGWISQENMRVGLCDYCSKITIWLKNQMLFPSKAGVPLPNEDLSSDIKKDYNEAAEIVEKSPKAAVAILRLVIEKLCKQLGENGKDLNDDIKNLVVKGLPVKIQKALDIVRVIGNESVHPGQINLDDDSEIAYRLFGLVNLIAHTMITQPKEINNLYADLPEKKIEGIEKRDGIV